MLHPVNISTNIFERVYVPVAAIPIVLKIALLNIYWRWVISAYRSEVDVICSFLGCYAASSGNSLDISGQPIGLIFKGQENQDFLILEDGGL